MENNPSAIRAVETFLAKKKQPHRPQQSPLQQQAPHQQPQVTQQDQQHQQQIRQQQQRHRTAGGASIQVGGGLVIGPVQLKGRLAARLSHTSTLPSFMQAGQAGTVDMQEVVPREEE
eukprot:1161949-Pelagomonas_calceolata.AAC.1